MNQPTRAGSQSEEPENDDAQVGRILSRREILSLFGFAGGTLLLAGCVPPPGATVPALNEEASTAVAMASEPAVQATATAEIATVEAVNTAVPACVVRPELTEGPYFVDNQLERSDIRSDPDTNAISEGVPLQLTVNVSQVGNNACTPLAGAMVDVWHCDALGVYSGVTDNMEGFATEGQKFLRGYQITNESGVAQFSTIYPGWYRGRTVHIHFKIRVGAGSDQSYEFTSQLFFDEALSDEVFTNEPYASKGQRDQHNNTDGIYNDLLLLSVVPAAEGYAAVFDIGLDLSDTATGRPDGIGGGPGGGPGRRGPGGPPPPPPTRGG